MGKRGEVTEEGQPVTVKAEDPPAQASHSQTAGHGGVPTPSQPPPRKCLEHLIGKRSMVSCAINGVRMEMLLASGAQVTMVERAWIDKALPNVRIQPLESLLSEQPLQISAANGTDVPLDGWVDVELQVCSENYGHVNIQVPLLISRNSLNCPLLGQDFFKSFCGNGI